jgi:Uma2 family endonuclease
MSLAEKKPDQNHYTYRDYLDWDEDYRAEIIDGQVYAMSPPTRRHQKISRKLSLKIGNFLEGKPCEVYYAPFAVRLFPKTDLSDDTVFEPDITVICDPSKLDDRGCNGAPDMIIEIENDMMVKFRKYLQARVREYWIVDPVEKTIHACILDNNQYRVSIYDETQSIPVSVLPGCMIELKPVFAD